MKSLLIKLLALMLVVATLLPFAVACDDDTPPPDEDEDTGTATTNPINPIIPPTGPVGGSSGSGGGSETETPVEKYGFKLNVDSETDKTLVDFTNQAFLNKSTYIANNVTEIDGTTVLKFDAGDRDNVKTDYANDSTVKTVPAELPEPVNLLYCTSIRFKVYCENATGSVIQLWLLNRRREDHNQYFGARINIPLDFTGWKSFDFPSTEISGAGARDNEAYSLRLAAQKLSNGTFPEDVIYISNIEMTTASYSYTAPDGVNPNDSALYKAITANARGLYVGNESVKDRDEFTSKIPGIDATCKNNLDLFNETKPDSIDTPDKLFNIAPVKSPFKGEVSIQSYYKYVKEMAVAYGTIGSEYYQDETVLEAIKYSLDYGYKHYYGPSLIEYGAYGNWWHWEIGIPIELFPTLIIIEDELTLDDCRKYLTAFDYFVPYPSAKGGNKIWLTRYCLLSAALRQDALDLCIATEYMNDLFDYIDDYVIDEGGFFPDGSFVQHFYYAYTSGYGGNYMGDLPQLMFYLHGTPFYPQQDNVENHFKWVSTSFRPVIYKKYVMSAFSGRNVGRINADEGSSSYGANMILMHYYAPDKYKAQLEPMIAYFFKIHGNLSKSVPKSLINYANDIYNKLKDAEVEPYEITRVYGMMARTVHHRPEYGVALSYSNMSVGKYESINDENRAGWYHGDGMIQIYTGNYTFNWKFYSFANPYLMPGTTVNSAERKLQEFNNPINNASNYAGGVSQGKYGTTGFILDYYDKGAASVAYSTFSADKDATIFAKKSYFFFDDEIICVGSDISDKSLTEVKTVLENRYWNTKEVNKEIVLVEELYIGDKKIDVPYDGNTSGEITEKTVTFSGMGGYVILIDDGNKLYYKKAENGYNGTCDYSEDSNPPDKINDKHNFFELYISHGQSKVDGTTSLGNAYYYAYLPNADVTATNAYSTSPDVALLHRDTFAHAVIHADKNEDGNDDEKLITVAANFFGGASTTVNVLEDYYKYTDVRSINTASPCSVMATKNADGSYTISVSDPTQFSQNTTVSVQIAGVTTCVSADTGVQATISGGTVTLNINTANSLGQTFNVTVR